MGNRGAFGRVRRLVTFGLSLAAAYVFLLLARELGGTGAGTKTLQFLLLPVAFPLFFLVYTETTSLLFVLLMLLAALGGRPGLAGLAGLAACLVRQNDIVWVAFAWWLCLARDRGALFPLPWLGRYAAC